MKSYLIDNWDKGAKIRRSCWRQADRFWQFDTASKVWTNQNGANVSFFLTELDTLDWEEWTASPFLDSAICYYHSFIDTGMPRTYCRSCQKAGYWREGEVILD